MHIGNLRTALYEYLYAKSKGGAFVLRIEDTDRARYTEGAVDIIYDTLRLTGIKHDEGPDVGGPYAPYVQSERKNEYLFCAERLIERGAAYRCFCGKEEKGEDAKNAEQPAKYDRRCLRLSKEEIAANLERGLPYVIRQLIPEGRTAFRDEVFGEITVENAEIEDQVLIKSDGLPTYNFANVIDDHLMDITHVMRGCEYLSSTPKYNLLYEAFGWDIPAYIHLPLILNENGEKLSKRCGDASFNDLIERGFLPEAALNYVALLGWAPPDNREIFTLEEMAEVFDVNGISKSPSKFDYKKLTWLNGEYFKNMDFEKFFGMAFPYIERAVKGGADKRKLAEMVKTRVSFLREIEEMLDFVDAAPPYDTALYTHKKMKTNPETALSALEAVRDNAGRLAVFENAALYEALTALAAEKGMKNSQLLWSVRTALSGKPTTPCGATELMELLGRGETFGRIEAAITKLKGELC
jgi:glutamyl-tRNA synthetase